MSGEFAIAVHALVYLNHKKTSRSSEELARNICTNAARVRKVLAPLKKAGLVKTKEGAEGGYLFCADPNEVNLCMIERALAIPAVTAGWRSGSQEMDCLIASGMADVLDGIYARLNSCCERELAAITLADIDRMIFKK